MAVALAVVGAGAGVQTWRIERLHGDLREARVQVTAANEATKASEAARDREARAATASYEGLQTTCTTLAAAGIQKGRTIERIISAPAPVAGGHRGIVGAGELRGVIGQTAAGTP